MAIEIFTATAQYGHIKGTASADRHDVEDFAEYLKKAGVLADADFVAGMELLSIPGGPEQIANVSVTAYVCDLAGREALAKAVEAGPVKVRKVRVEMSINKFFGLFKRVSIKISPGGLLNGRELFTEE